MASCMRAKVTRASRVIASIFYTSLAQNSTHPESDQLCNQPFLETRIFLLLCWAEAAVSFEFVHDTAPQIPLGMPLHTIVVFEVVWSEWLKAFVCPLSGLITANSLKERIKPFMGSFCA